MPRRFGLISDTHGFVHRDVHRIFADVEEILHAGDVGGEHVLEELKIIASVQAISGNVDHHSTVLPLSRTVEMPFGRVGMAHGHMFPADRERRGKALREHFAAHEVRLILHGHSHLPLLERRGGAWLLNPGAAGRPRFGIPSSVCVLEWDPDHDLLRFDFQPLGWS